MTTALIILGWVLCGVAAFGGTFAHFQRAFPTIAKCNRRSNYAFAAFVALLGPVGLIVCTIAGGFFEHGWMITPDKQNEEEGNEAM